MKKGLVKKILAYLSSFVFLILFWIIGAGIINASLILPAPDKVIFKLKNLFTDKIFWISFFFTFLRVIISFIISVFLGIILGLISSLSSFFRDFIKFPVAVIRITPVIAVILLALFWFNSNWLPVFVSVLMCLPVMITAVEKGFSQTNNERVKKMICMAETYRLSKYQVYRYILYPESKASVFSGIENCFGLCWKVTVAGEVLCLPAFACGSLMQKAQVHLETTEVMAITILIIILSFSLQMILKAVIRKGLKNDTVE